jgi:hypothetical protein
MQVMRTSRIYEAQVEKAINLTSLMDLKYQLSLFLYGTD